MKKLLLLTAVSVLTVSAAHFTEVVIPQAQASSADLDKQLFIEVGKSNGDPDTVEALTKKGANPNAIDGEGRTPLYFAVMNDNAKLAERLLKVGAKITAGEKGKDTKALATRKGNKDVKKVLGL